MERSGDEGLESGKERNSVTSSQAFAIQEFHISHTSQLRVVPAKQIQLCACVHVQILDIISFHMCAESHL